MDTFNFCGKIALGKENEKFHPIDRRVFQSGWTNTTVRFNCLSGSNRILCTTQGGKWQDDKKNIVKTFSKSVTDENGNVTKGEAIDIPWVKRFDADQIDKVAGFRKFTVDLGDLKMRRKLQNLIKAFENGTDADELIEETGISNIEDAKAALEKSIAKKKVFITEWDFAEYVAKLAASDKYKKNLFYISGNYDITYNSEKEVYYTNYRVNRIALAADDAALSTELKIDLYYGENAWDDSRYEETGKYNVNGWLSYYDNTLKKNGFMPIVIAVKEDDEKKLNVLKRKFTVDDGIKQIGLTLSVLEGAERVEITMEMLDEETREDIECGLLTFEDVKRQYGGRINGEKVSELRFAELTPKKNVPQDTMYAVEDMHAAKMEVIEDADIDIFDDEDDL